MAAAVAMDVVTSATGIGTFALGIGTAIVTFGILEIFVMGLLLFDATMIEIGPAVTGTLTREIPGRCFAAAVLAPRRRFPGTIETREIP